MLFEISMKRSSPFECKITFTPAGTKTAKQPTANQQKADRLQELARQLLKQLYSRQPPPARR